MPRSDDDIHHLTEADRTSQTRFGPRPVPEGHRTASPYPHRPAKASRIPPGGPVSPDGKEVWPEPSLTSKIVVWGGMAVGAAALTAGAVLATRKLADAISGEDDRPARPAPYRGYDADRPDGSLAPRFADMNEDEREAIRRRERDRARREAAQAAKTRSRASRSRNFVGEVTETATALTDGLNDVTRSLNSAFDGFRGVAAQANAIVAEFVAAADQLRGLMDRGAAPTARDKPDSDQPDDPRSHRL